MGHHYVPQKLLRHFAVPGQPKMIWMYDKKSCASKRISIKSAAQEPEFYREDVEKNLASTIESPANLVMDKLLRKDLLTDAERETLSVYIAIMITRGPRYRRNASATMPKALAKTVDDAKREIHELAEKEDSPPEKLERWLAEIDRVHQRIAEKPPPDVVDRIRTPWASDRMISSIQQMDWHVISTGPETFVTGDTPVHFFESMGIGKLGSEFTFPLSPNMALLGQFQNGPGTLTFHDTKRKLVKEVNRRMISHAERFVFSHIDHDWITSISRKVPQLNRLAWH